MPAHIIKNMWIAVRKHWIKNFFIFAAIIFVSEFTDIYKVTITLYAFFVFCLVSSSTYIINDLFDITEDKKHPKKRNRPIALGALSIPLAASLVVNNASLSYKIVYKIRSAHKLNYFVFKQIMCSQNVWLGSRYTTILSMIGLYNLSGLYSAIIDGTDILLWAIILLVSMVGFVYMCIYDEKIKAIIFGGIILSNTLVNVCVSYTRMRIQILFMFLFSFGIGLQAIIHHRRNGVPI